MITRRNILRGLAGTAALPLLPALPAPEPEIMLDLAGSSDTTTMSFCEAQELPSGTYIARVVDFSYADAERRVLQYTLEMIDSCEQVKGTLRA